MTTKTMTIKEFLNKDNLVKEDLTKKNKSFKVMSSKRQTELVAATLGASCTAYAFIGVKVLVALLA